MDKQKLLFEQLKLIKDSWSNTAVKGLDEKEDLRWTEVEDKYRILQKKLTSEEEREAYKKVVNEIIEGVMHSILVMVDGGSHLAESILIDITELETNESLSKDTALHEEFIGYLVDVEDK